MPVKELSILNCQLQSINISSLLLGVPIIVLELNTVFKPVKYSVTRAGLVGVKGEVLPNRRQRLVNLHQCRIDPPDVLRRGHERNGAGVLVRTISACHSQERPERVRRSQGCDAPVRARRKFPEMKVNWNEAR